MNDGLVRPREQQNAFFQYEKMRFTIFLVTLLQFSNGLASASMSDEELDAEQQALLELCADGQWVLVYDSLAGVKGDPFRPTPAYDGECPVNFPGTGVVGFVTGSYHTVEQGIANGYRVTQHFIIDKAAHAAKRPYSKALDHCIDRTSSSPPQQFTGSCFSFPGAEEWQTCGGKSSGYMGGTFELGKSSIVTSDCTATSGWCWSHTRFSTVTKTRIEMWQCPIIKENNLGGCFE